MYLPACTETRRGCTKKQCRQNIMPMSALRRGKGVFRALTVRAWINRKPLNVSRLRSVNRKLYTVDAAPIETRNRQLLRSFNNSLRKGDRGERESRVGRRDYPHGEDGRGRGGGGVV